jgi:hypothetical protein
MKRRRKRRSAVEPKIGHLKSDHRMQRCFLKGLIGDAINATLAAAGSNLLKLLRALAHALIFWLRYAFSGPGDLCDSTKVLIPPSASERIDDIEPLRSITIVMSVRSVLMSLSP